MANLKKIYQATIEEGALQSLNGFGEKLNENTPKSVNSDEHTGWT